MIRDITLGQYYDTDSVLHRLDPRVKLAFTFIYIISLFVGHGPWCYAYAAAFLVFVGDRLGIDLYYVALLTFGFRIFKNLAILRRHLLKKHGLERPHLPDE